jgi:hypothetical protein
MSKMRGWVRLFMPDFSWLALICGSFSLVWSILRTGLILKALQKSLTSNTRMEEISS